MGEETEKTSADIASSVPAEPLVEKDSNPAGEGGEEEKKIDAVAIEEKKIDASPSFVEESYYVKDLKDSEKKALIELKAKIQEAIATNSFLIPPKPPVKAVEEEKKEEEKKEEEKKEEEKKEEKKEEEKKEEEKKEEEKKEEEKKEEEKKEEEVEKKEIFSPDKEEALAIAIAKEDVKENEESTEALNREENTDKDLKGEETSFKAEEDISIETEKEGGDGDGEEGINDDDSPSLEDLDLWGVPLLHTKGDERTDVVLLKFLRARDFKVNEAMEMLKGTLAWRREFFKEGGEEEEAEAEDGEKKKGEEAEKEAGAEEEKKEEEKKEDVIFDSVAYMHGFDREGHPVCYNSYGVFQDKELYQKTFGDESRFKRFLRWRIGVVEEGISSLDFRPGGAHSILQVLDLHGSPGFVKRRHITKRAFAILQDNYPELVAKQIFINVPWYFGALISLHGKFITSRTKSKYVVARPDKATETLFKYISPENVPIKYGGLSRPNDTEFAGVDAPVKEITVKVGEKQTIEFPVEESGTVVWDVSVVGWEVVYGEEFVPSQEGGYTVIIQKTKKVLSSEEPIRNSFKATEPGKVVLTIDNNSRRKKLAVYRHIIVKKEEAF